MGQLRSGQFRGQKGLGPLEKSRELSHYEFCPRKENNISHFPNQRCIGYFMSQRKERGERREERREKREKRRETRDERQETRDEIRDMRYEGRETRDERREARDERRET